MAPLAATAAFIAVNQGGLIMREGSFGSSYSRAGVAAIAKRRYFTLTKITSPNRFGRNNHNILYASDEDDTLTHNDEVGENVIKPSSPLAMAAADWLEEEEDELAMYWDRYDVAKKNSDSSKEPSPSTPAQPLRPKDDDDTTTEERLDRYYQSRNIDRGMERQHSSQIKQVIEKSKKASSPDEAILLLTPIRQFLQYNTKLGGNAYFELAQALDANDQVDEATDIYEQLASSPHVEIRRKSRELLAMGSSRRKRTYNKSVWNWLWDV